MIKNLLKIILEYIESWTWQGPTGCTGLAGVSGISGPPSWRENE